jgi:phosphoserine phosphatase
MELTADLFRSVEREVLDRFLMDNYNQLQRYIPEAMKEQLQTDRANGYHTVLLSGNLNLILEPFRNDGFDTIIGTIIEKDGRLLSSKEVQIIIEEGKRQTILERFKDADFKASKAYADSHYDYPILELVGHPVAVNPDQQLRDLATTNNWEIMDI